MKNLIKHILCAGVAAIAMVGCGGSADDAVTPASRAQIVDALAAGFQTRSLTENVSTDRMPGTRSEGATPEFDEEYQLWARPGALRRDFFVDEAMTQPAGSERWTLTTLWNGFDAAWSIQVTQGVKAGFQMDADTSMRNGRFTFSASGRDEEGRRFSGTGASTNTGFSLDWTIDGPDGRPWRYRVNSLESGASTVEYTSARNLRFSLNFAVDGSGSGTITGVSNLLPAQIAWNAAGTGTVTFADNSQAAFNDFEFANVAP